mmetsp:Transcript_52145/g.117421  ORF Transcript_52145/g.117421 Transcript_52145/m.117421 type:complete len:533 (-) Transcript_52145:40-1638(-)
MGEVDFDFEIVPVQQTDNAAEERRQGEDIRLGVTDPISLGLPTPAELALNEQLLEEMRRDAPMETPEGLRHRRAVLVELQRVVAQWVFEVSVQHGMDDMTAKMAGAKIFTFGSYRLGVIGPGSDIDALCVTPQHLTRESFFQVLVAKLQEHPDVQELSPVPDAYVPIIKMKLSDVDIDLLFGRVCLQQVPEHLENLSDDNLLRNLDDGMVRSLNGCRVADQILALVPDPVTYKDTLRLVKLWAKRRSIYSNVLGFFGGITWAILVARVCQLFPHFCAAALVKRFFRVYDRWNWKAPVLLCPIREESSVTGLMAFKVWNPKKYPKDRLHLMPIITPAFPSMNSTYNVSESTKRILMQEFARGSKIAAQVQQGKCQWAEVYKPLPFFTQHKHFLHMEVFARSMQVFTKWTGWVESKLRHLVKQLEQLPEVQVRPLADQIKFQDKAWPFAIATFFGLTLQGSVNLRQPVTQFVEMVNTWSHRDEHAGQFEMKVRHVERRDLPHYVLTEEQQQKRKAKQLAKQGESAEPPAKRQLQ